MGAKGRVGTPQSDKPYELPPEGPVAARCIHVVELGTHFNEKYQKEEEKIAIVWELSGDLMEDGRPFVVDNSYTNIISENSNLNKMLVAWRGKAFTDAEAKSFDMAKILDKCCMINVVHRKNKEGDKTFANIGSIMPLPKGMACEDRHNELVNFGIEDYGTAEFDKVFPKWKKQIEKSKEVTEGSSSHGDDDAPFD